MSYGAVALAALLVLGPTCAAEGPPFSTELSLGFGYEESSTDRPLVVLDGAPTDSYAYSADSRAHLVEVAATRWLVPVGDDGTTPLALLPYVAHVSSVAARAGLTGSNRASFGSFSGQESTYEVRFSGDGTLREAGVSAEWFLVRGLSVRGGFEYGNERETAASVSQERPSGRTEVATAGTRGSNSTGSLGLAFRLGDHEVSVSGSYGGSDVTRDDASAFTGGAQPYSSTFTTDGLVRQGTVATRLLFLRRRIAVDAAATYSLATSSSDLASSLSGPFSTGRTIARAASIEATVFATRRLGLTAGFEYTTRDASSGSPGLLRLSSASTGRTFSARVRWSASERVWVELSGAHDGTVTVTPPDGTTFQRFEESTDRARLGAVLRF